MARRAGNAEQQRNNRARHAERGGARRARFRAAAQALTQYSTAVTQFFSFNQ